MARWGADGRDGEVGVPQALLDIGMELVRYGAHWTISALVRRIVVIRTLVCIISALIRRIIIISTLICIISTLICIISTL